MKKVKTPIKELKNRYENALHRLVGLKFSLAMHSSSISKKERKRLEKKIQELEPKFRLACDAYHDAIPHYREFKDARSKDPNTVMQTFLKIPKCYRNYCLHFSVYGAYLGLEKGGKLGKCDEVDKYMLDLAKMLKKMVHVDSLDDLDRPSPSQALAILAKMKRKTRMTWPEYLQFLKMQYGLRLRKQAR